MRRWAAPAPISASASSRIAPATTPRPPPPRPGVDRRRGARRGLTVLGPPGASADRLSIMAADDSMLVESDADRDRGWTRLPAGRRGGRCPFSPPGPLLRPRLGRGWRRRDLGRHRASGNDERRSRRRSRATTCCGAPRATTCCSPEIRYATCSTAGRDGTRWSPRAPTATPSRAGGGDDQLVTDYPCGGHIFDGGADFDIAGFALARYERVRLVASLGGTAVDPRIPGCKPTVIDVPTRSSRGPRGSDVLYGNDADNPLILGRGGDDTIYGLGGDDLISGDKRVGLALRRARHRPAQCDRQRPRSPARLHEGDRPPGRDRPSRDPLFVSLGTGVG